MQMKKNAAPRKAEEAEDQSAVQRGGRSLSTMALLDCAVCCERERRNVVSTPFPRLSQVKFSPLRLVLGSIRLSFSFVLVDIGKDCFFRSGSFARSFKRMRHVRKKRLSPLANPVGESKLFINIISNLSTRTISSCGKKLYTSRHAPREYVSQLLALVRYRTSRSIEQ